MVSFSLTDSETAEIKFPGLQFVLGTKLRLLCFSHPPLWDAPQLSKRLIINALRVQLRNLCALKPAFQ